MKTELKLFEKLKICFIFLTNHQFKMCLIERCPQCKSTRISKTYSLEKEIEKGSVYQANYKCDQCGAEAAASENWHYVN